MAASVTYQIKGKYDGTAAKNAKSDLSGVAKSLKGLGVAAWAKLSGEAIKALSSVVNGSADAFMNQNKAAKTLQTSIKNSNKDFSELVKMQNKLSKNNFFDGDSINNAEAMAINMGLTEDQVINVMNAAEDLAASGIMPLDQAVKTLSQSYSGNVATLGKMIPDVKNLTKEELANGDAVALIAKQYDGFADSMSNTFSGRNTQWTNSFSDLQASVGGIIQSFKFLSQGSFLQPLNSVTNWITENRENIIKTVLNLPAICKTVFSSIQKMVSDTFTGEGMINLFTYLGQLMIASIKTGLKTVFELVKMMFTQINNVWQFLIDGFLKPIKNLGAKIGNFFIETLNKVIQKVTELPFIKSLMNLLGVDTSNVITFRFKEDERSTGQQIMDAFGELFENTKDNVKTTVQAYKDNMVEQAKAIKEATGEFASFYSDDQEEMIKQIRDIINNADIPEDLKQALNTQLIATEATTDAVESSDTSSGSLAISEGDEGGMNQLTEGSITDMGGVETQVLGWLMSLDNLMSILDPINTMLEAAEDVLGPVIEEILAPLSNMLKVIGQTVGLILVPLLQTLTPIISAVSDAFIWLYNKVIVPVGNAFVTVFVTIKNTVASMLNVLIGAINKVGKIVGLHVNKVSLDSADDYKLSTIDSSTLAENSSSSSSSASSYTAARDIYVNIIYDHSFVNGDATQIAIMMKNEIENATKLGY